MYDRIGAVDHHDRDRLSFSFERCNHHIAGRHYHAHLEAHQLMCELRKTFDSALFVANLQDERRPFDMAKLPQRLPERFDRRRENRWSGHRKEPDLRELGRLLRLRHERRGKQACTDGAEKPAAVHYSMT